MIKQLKLYISGQTYGAPTGFRKTKFRRETVLERPGVGQKQTMHNHELHATFKVRGQVGISRGLDASHSKDMPNDDELGM